MNTRIFVYGTLLHGEPNHGLLARARLVGPTWTAPLYRFVSLGGFPALLHGGKTSIAGEVYEVDEETLARLDRLEGHPRFYRRETIDLHDDDGSGDVAGRVEAYVLQEEPRNADVIQHGKWRTYRASRAYR